MLTVHHLDLVTLNPFESFGFWMNWRVLALGSLFELKLYQRNEGDRLAPPEYKALSPLGTAPTITTDTGLVMNESNAIIEYILDLAEDVKKDSPLRPPISSPNRAAYLFWFHGVQGSMQPMLTVDIIFRRAAIKTPWPISSVVKYSKVRDAVVMPRLKGVMEMAEKQLEQDDFLSGSSFTAADITAIYPFASIFSRYPEFSKTYPKTQAWLDRMVSRPAYKAAQTKVKEEGGIVFENE